jgi:hypothetical protein
MRFWTLDEANAALERVHAIVERIRNAVAKAREHEGRVSGNGSSNGQGTRARTDREVGPLLDELKRDGIVLRDVDRGLVDFPAVSPSGRQYWLCWIVDEPAVEWWHWPEDGFPGRTPLSQPPE